MNRPGGSGYWAPSLWPDAAAGRGEGPDSQEDGRLDREPRHVKATTAERPRLLVLPSSTSGWWIARRGLPAVTMPPP